MKTAEQQLPQEAQGRTYIRFDGPPDHEAGRFVEVEHDGKGINFGEWVQDGDYWLLVVPDRWTYISESKPEPDSVVLATIRATEDNKSFQGKANVQPVYCDEDGEYWLRMDGTLKTRINNGKWAVVAWQPLPGPAAEEASQ